MIKEEIKKQDIISKTKTKVSEFFLHLLTYGIFSYKKGEIYLFNNPYTFIPISTLATLQYELDKEFPIEANELLEWLGRVDGRTASLAMVFKYGMNKENIEKLLSAGTLTGLGNLKLKKLSPDNVIVTCDNSPLAILFKKKYGKTKNPVDFYIMGALVGADKPLFGKNAFAQETKCIAKGDKYCEYDMKIGTYNPPKIIKETLNISPEYLLDIVSKNFLKRMKKGAISIRTKNINFGDGTFTFNSIQGIAIPMFVLVILNEILYKYKAEVRNNIFQTLAKSYIFELSSQYKINSSMMTSATINKILDNIGMFGFGQFKLQSSNKKAFYIELFSNNFSKEYISLYGHKKEPLDFFVCRLIEEIFSVYFNKKVKCQEKRCIVQRQKTCLFEILLS